MKEIAVGRGGGYPVQTDEEEIEQKIQTQVEDLKAAGLDATYEQLETTAGGAAHAIADAATDAGADLIVVGTRGQAPITGLLLRQRDKPLASRFLVSRPRCPTGVDHDQWLEGARSAFLRRQGGLEWRVETR